MIIQMGWPPANIARDLHYLLGLVLAFLEKKVKVNVRNFFQGSFRPLAQSTGLTKQRQIFNTSKRDTHDNQNKIIFLIIGRHKKLI